MVHHRGRNDPDRSAPGVGESLVPEGLGVRRIREALFLEKQRVLFAGPEVTNGPRAKLPGRDTGAWVRRLAELESLKPTVVIPGQGSWGGPPILARQRRFLAELRRQAAYGISMGRPVEDLIREVSLPASCYTWMPYDTPRPEDIRHVYYELTVPQAPFGGQPPERDDAQPHALVLIGDRFHEPGHIVAGLAPVFQATGVAPHFTVDVQALTARNLARVRLLVVLRDGMLWPEGPDQPYRIWMTPEQEKAVVDFVESGGGFLNLHNSMGLYPENGPYLKLVGGRYIGHGPLERFRVEVVDRDHPVTRGVEDYFAADEQHTPPWDENKVRLLLRSRSDEGQTAAAGWAYEPGRGRLCHLAGGHTREALEHPMFQALLRNAVNWCLRR
jgi:type 1 glutamine amidotransferase